MNEQTLNDMREHAVSDYPAEACGLVAIINGEERYLPITNRARTPQEHFVMDAEQVERVETMGEVIAMFHSHPDAASTPSPADRVQCEVHGVPWIIISVGSTGDQVTVHDVHTFEPSGYEAPLVGRPFVSGILDCYSLIRDYYARELKIDLPAFDERRDEWWKHGENLYVDNLQENGFETVKGALLPGDMILMQIRSPVPNHGAVYIGDGMILHHMYGRMSSRDLYAGYFQETTVKIVRHKDAHR